MKVSIIITAHNEGVLLGPTLKSADAAIIEFQRGGGLCEKLIGLDKPNRETRDYLRYSKAAHGWKVFNYEHGDPGELRNSLVRRSTGTHIAFLDGDDLFSPNWLKRCAEVWARSNNERLILHPEVNWIFDESNHVWFKTDMASRLFTPFYFYFGNHYDTLCFGPKRCFTEIPYERKERNKGYGYEDWAWNMSTIASGWAHKIVPNTVIFKRRRLNSVSTMENAGGFVPTTTPLHNIEVMRRLIR
jgi:glycosyltransferase involved in cell wall biosynthesis